MSFKDIYGQDQQVAILQKTVMKGRVPHAYLFYGMDGIGKKTTAVELAKTLNCKEGTSDSCDACVACRKIDNGNHADIFIIQTQGVLIKIEEIRNLQDQAKYRPFEGKKRVFIIDSAEKMNVYAANALLKILEEPGPSNLLILISSRPYLLPQTITSRCQKIRFSPLRRESVAAFLVDKISMDDQSALILASLCEGSIERALAMRDDSYIAVKNDLIERIASSGGGKNPLQLLLLANDFGGDRIDTLEKINIIKSWYRDVLLLMEMKNSASLFHPDCADMTKEFSEKITLQGILNSLKTLGRAYLAIENNANKQLTLESMIFKLAKLRQTQGMDALNG